MQPQCLLGVVVSPQATHPSLCSSSMSLSLSLSPAPGAAGLRTFNLANLSVKSFAKLPVPSGFTATASGT